MPRQHFDGLLDDLYAMRGIRGQHEFEASAARHGSDGGRDVARCITGQAARGLTHVQHVV